VFRKIFTLMVLLLTLTALVRAQDITPREDDEIDPAAHISWPPPVYVLRDTIELRGSASISNMTNYFIEFRPLEFVDETETDAETDSDRPWFPVTLPSNIPVQDDILGTWNTQTTDDGLYEIRLTINVSRQSPIYFVVSPLRIENEPPPFVTIEALPPTIAPVIRPTLAPSPTPLDTTPRVTANLNANVRTGDSTGYSIITQLPAGESARVIGISSTGSGWYFIEMANGRRGWIAPSVVTPSGDIRSVPFVSPPPTPTPAATATPTPLPATGNLTGSLPSINPNPPTCGVPFQVLVNITNSGNLRTNVAATVVIRDIHVATGLVQAEAIRSVPEIDPGQNFVVGADFTVSTYYNEEHRITVLIDTSNLVPETNEADNTLASSYVLQKGACP
jgi:hypothetical protein